MMNTLKIYKDSLKAGFSEEQSLCMANTSENLLYNLKEEFNNLKGEFASNKLTAFFGTLIIAIGGFTLNKVIDIDKRVSVLESKIEMKYGN